MLKTVEVPQLQYIDEIIDELIVGQRQVPIVQTVQKTVDVPQVQFHDRVVDVPALFVKEQITEVAQHGPQEHVRDSTTEQSVDVPVTHSRVFIMNDCDELIPEWLNVVKGVIDSEGLPMNISRETLQQNKILRVIKKDHVKKRLDILAEIAELNDDYKKFYERCVKCMNLGICENSVDDSEIAKLLRLNTSMSGDEQISSEVFVDPA